MKNLIIGKNSKLVKEIQNKLDENFEFISHIEINNINFSNYSRIYLFSWPKNNFEHFFNEIKSIPPHKLIFISTSAVLANQFRNQWNAYPIQKAVFENRLISSGSKIIRIGITNQDHLKYFSGYIPFTSISNIVSIIQNLHNYSDSIIDAFDIRCGTASTLIKLISNVLWLISRALPSTRLIQSTIQGIAKYTGLKNYGYTADSNYFFHDIIQIGYGALGRCNLPSLNGMDYLIITSKKKDVILNSNGFIKTRIGRSTIGLARLWHGVSLRINKDGKNFKKNVPIFIDRSAPPFFRHVSHHVEKIENHMNHWRIITTNSNAKEKIFFCNKLVLAAGPLINIDLLQNITKKSTSLSDHEISMVGQLSLNDSLRFGLTKRTGPFLTPGTIINESTIDGINFIMEARPYVAQKHSSNQHENSAFYLDSSKNIFSKLLKDFSFSRVNEAFFNKFGLSIPTNTCSIFVQALVSNCIRLQASDAPLIERLYRHRLDSTEWIKIQQKIKEIIPEFRPDHSISSIDAQHILGGKELCNDLLISTLNEQGRLTILGSPTKMALTPKHHTVDLQRHIRCHLHTLLFLPKYSSTNDCHKEIIDAILQYAKTSRIRACGSLLSAIKEINSSRIIYFQKSSLKNIPIAIFALILGKKRILYLHEPLTISQRRQKSVPLIKSILVTAFQLVETRLMSSLLTGNKLNTSFYNRALTYAPLLLPEFFVKNQWQRRSNNILYFGRLDYEKLFHEFTKLNTEKTICATSTLNILKKEYEIASVTFEKKSEIFQNHRFVWCVQRNSLTQSAVVIDAIKFGCCCLLRDDDPMTKILHPSEFIRIPLNFDTVIVNQRVQEYLYKNTTGPVQPSSFTNLCGQLAYNKFWKIHLDEK